MIKCGTAQFEALDKADITAYRKMDYEWQVLITIGKKWRGNIPKQ